MKPYKRHTITIMLLFRIAAIMTMSVLMLSIKTYQVREDLERMNEDISIIKGGLSQLELIE